MNEMLSTVDTSPLNPSDADSRANKPDGPEKPLGTTDYVMGKLVDGTGNDEGFITYVDPNKGTYDLVRPKVEGEGKGKKVIPGKYHRPTIYQKGAERVNFPENLEEDFQAMQDLFNSG